MQFHCTFLKDGIVFCQNWDFTKYAFFVHAVGFQNDHAVFPGKRLFFLSFLFRLYIRFIRQQRESIFIFLTFLLFSSVQFLPFYAQNVTTLIYIKPVNPLPGQKQKLKQFLALPLFFNRCHYQNISRQPKCDYVAYKLTR